MQKESQKADEYLREIKEQSLLSEAVRQCVEAAGHEHEPETQKTLLRVSHTGWLLREERPFIYRRNDTKHGFMMYLPLSCSPCRQLHLGSASWVIFLQNSLSACVETCGCWMQYETIPWAFLLPTLSSNRWPYRCSSTGEMISGRTGACFHLFLWLLPSKWLKF